MTHPALSIAKTGLDAQQVLAATTANNLANASTHGFKSNKPIFSELMYQKIRQPGGASTSGNELPEGLMLGTGVRITGTSQDLKAGSPVRTDQPYDIFINGSGYFQILQDDNTTAYTRNGHFKITNTGIMVDSGGRQLVPTITIPANTNSVTIGRDGTVSVKVAGSIEPTTVGTITLAEFISPSGLEPLGDSLYLETAASGSPTVGNPGQNGVGQIEQLSLEGSNVNVVEELVSLIEGQRSYEMNAKVIEAVDDMLKFASQVL